MFEDIKAKLASQPDDEVVQVIFHGSDAIIMFDTFNEAKEYADNHRKPNDEIRFKKISIVSGHTIEIELNDNGEPKASSRK